MARHQRTSDANDRITVARLDGTARRLLDEGAPSDQAISAIHRITRDPQLLARTGGTALGVWRVPQTGLTAGRDVADLMVQAGADAELVRRVADETAARMSRRRAWGS